MERIEQKSNRLRAAALGVVLSIGGLGLVACSEKEAPRPKTIATAENLFAAGSVTAVRPGDSVMVAPMTDKSAKEQIKKALDIVDHQYPHGFDDEMAATASKMPIRVDAHYAMGGKSPSLNNDLACDAVNVDLEDLQAEKAYLGILVLSDDQDDKVLVSWPSPDRAYVCMTNDHEPSDGVILFAADAGR